MSSNQIVLIPAASSSVGLAAIQITRKVGAVPVALTRTSAKASALRAAGAAHVIATQEQDLRAEISRLTDSKGADLVFDPVGGANFGSLLEATKAGGTLIVYGALGGPVASVPVMPLLGRGLTIRGFGLTSVTKDDAKLAANGSDFSPVPFRIVASWPAPAFVENVAVGPDGSVFVTVQSQNRVDRYDPKTGKTSVFAELPAPPMALAFDESGSLWVTGSTMKAPPGYIWKISAKGEVQRWTDLPGATFLNGCAVHPNGRELLVCESRSSRVLSIDVREPNKWSVWLEDELIGPGESPRTPGANGIKIRGCIAYITVSARYLITSTPIQADGSAGPIETAWRDVIGDDFAFGESGSLYVTTHPVESLVRIDPSGKRTTIAGPDQGMVGSTACAFGTAPGDETALYVCADGGFTVPREDGVQDAKLVRLEVGESGYRLLGNR